MDSATFSIRLPSRRLECRMSRARLTSFIGIGKIDCGWGWGDLAASLFHQTRSEFPAPIGQMWRPVRPPPRARGCGRARLHGYPHHPAIRCQACIVGNLICGRLQGNRVVKLLRLALEYLKGRTGSINPYAIRSGVLEDQVVCPAGKAADVCLAVSTSEVLSTDGVFVVSARPSVQLNEVIRTERTGVEVLCDSVGIFVLDDPGKRAAREGMQRYIECVCITADLTGGNVVPAVLVSTSIGLPAIEPDVIPAPLHPQEII